MAATETAPTSALRAIPQIVAHDVRPQPRGWTSWITTTDHKRIGILYLVPTFAFFLIGATEALMMPLHLGPPANPLLDPQPYNELSTMHGRTMIFLLVV